MHNNRNSEGFGLRVGVVRFQPRTEILIKNVDPDLLVEVLDEFPLEVLLLESELAGKLGHDDGEDDVDAGFAEESLFDEFLVA
jgi:hypothetical protein